MPANTMSMIASYVYDHCFLSTAYHSSYFERSTRCKTQSIGKHLLNTFPNLDASRVYAYGGSHGGFLTGHLIARPDIQIRAASMVNAVTNMAHSVGTTDIPDWYAHNHVTLVGRANCRNVAGTTLRLA
jgi:predicted peptidase